MEPAMIALLITAAANLLVSLGNALPVRGLFKAKVGECCELEVSHDNSKNVESETNKD